MDGGIENVGGTGHERAGRPGPLVPALAYRLQPEVRCRLRVTHSNLELSKPI